MLRIKLPIYANETANSREAYDFTTTIMQSPLHRVSHKREGWLSAVLIDDYQFSIYTRTLSKYY